MIDDVPVHDCCELKSGGADGMDRRLVSQIVSALAFTSTGLLSSIIAFVTCSFRPQPHPTRVTHTSKPGNLN